MNNTNTRKHTQRTALSTYKGVLARRCDELEEVTNVNLTPAQVKEEVQRRTTLLLTACSMTIIVSP